MMQKVFSWVSDRLAEHSTQMALAIMFQVLAATYPDYANYCNGATAFIAAVVAARKG